MKPALSRLRLQARNLRTETYALYLTVRDPRTPWYAKLLVAGIAAYALSPIDLIPDFIPVLGYLDDLILIPLGIALAIRLVPGRVLTDCRAQVEDAFREGKPVSRVAGAVIIAIWLLFFAFCVLWAYQSLLSRNP